MTKAKGHRKGAGNTNGEAGKYSFADDEVSWTLLGDVKSYIKKIYDQHVEELDLNDAPNNEMLEFKELTKLMLGGRYEGYWNKLTKKKSGLGLLVYDDGSIYHGHWKNDVQNGKGLRVFIDTDSYIGEFRDGKMDGQGKFTSDKYTYIGDWRDGK
uniref:Uncharacterized protein n=1 Tax=Euplotes harpa TaxID=151035 RepID=A0A7S3NDU3_9SPIT|mmetsp:Transcript_35099/g.40560  ORF Transcript_35099/g.40560 Transcript_35099/m.40560 type:complete len:155 (+) Transcript_35099:70-534(+)